MKCSMSKAAHKAENAKEKCPRPYRLGQRETAMEETRVRIVEAARQLILSDNALQGFSMEAVARQANVTRVTIYHRFGSKRGLLEALFDDMGARGRLAERLPQVFAQEDAREALRLYVEVFCDFWAGERAINRRLGGFVALDNEFAEAIAARAGRRRHGTEAVLRRLYASGPGLSPKQLEQKVRITLALTGFNFYEVLAGENNGPREVAPIMFDLVLAALKLDTIKLND
jgi:AcrR family transcriptional regulator